MNEMSLQREVELRNLGPQRTAGIIVGRDRFRLQRDIACAALLLLVMLFCAWTVSAQEKITVTPPTALAAAPALVPAADIPKPSAAVPLDDQLRLLLEDQRVLSAAIELTENAKGKVELRYSVAELRALLDARQKAVSIWLRGKGVGAMCPGEKVPGETCWRFNPATGLFEPPAPAASSSSPSNEAPSAPPAAKRPENKPEEKKPEVKP